MRSRLLWWKEALVSPSAGVSYRDIDRKAVPGLIAYDYQGCVTVPRASKCFGVPA